MDFSAKLSARLRWGEAVVKFITLRLARLGGLLLFPLGIMGGIVLAASHRPHRLALRSLFTVGRKMTPGMLESLSDVTIVCCFIMGAAMMLFIMFYQACSAMRGGMVAREQRAREVIGVIQAEKKALREARELEGCSSKAKRSAARKQRL